MASIRKRRWKRPDGRDMLRYQCDYLDGHNQRRSKQFKTRKAAETWLAETLVSVRAGMHTPDAMSITVQQAAELWLERCETVKQLRGSTIGQYRAHVKHHVNPLIGDTKLSKLTVPALQDFADRLGQDRSPTMVRKVLTSLSSIFGTAQILGHVGHNPVQGAKLDIQRRETKEVEIPTLAQIREVLTKASGQWRPLIYTSVFTGCRVGELRALQWQHVDLKSNFIRIRQSADNKNGIGPTKTKAGRRDIPIGPVLRSVFLEWKVAQPVEQRVKDLVFPRADGEVAAYTVWLRYGWWPLQVKCGLADECGTDKKGNPVYKARFGFHALRHAAASLFVLEGWNAKQVQRALGHENIAFTLQTYAKLFDDAEDRHAAMARVEDRVLNNPGV